MRVHGVCGWLLVASVLAFVAIPARADELTQDPISGRSVVMRAMAASVGVSTLSLVLGGMGAAIVNDQPGSLILALGSATLLPPILSTLTLRAFAGGGDDLWSPLALSLGVRLATLVGASAFAVGTVGHADPGMLAGLILGAFTGALAEGVWFADWSAAPQRTRLGEFTLAVRASESLFVPGSSMVFNLGVVTTGGVEVARGHTLGARLHAGWHAWRAGSAAGSLGGVVDGGLRYAWQASTEGSRPFLAAWGGGFFDFGCGGDVCGALGFAGGAEAGLHLPNLQAVTVALQLDVARFAGAGGRGLLVTPALALGFVR